MRCNYVLKPCFVPEVTRFSVEKFKNDFFFVKIKSKTVNRSILEKFSFIDLKEGAKPIKNKLLTFLEFLIHPFVTVISFERTSPFLKAILKKYF